MINMTKKISMNRRQLDSPFFAIRKEKVKWPTIRKAYMTDDNVKVLKEYVTKKGRSIIFLDGKYDTTLNRYKNLPPEERAISWEFMCREKGVKGGIFMYIKIPPFTPFSLHMNSQLIARSSGGRFL